MDLTRPVPGARPRRSRCWRGLATSSWLPADCRWRHQRLHLRHPGASVDWGLPAGYVAVTTSAAWTGGCLPEPTSFRQGGRGRLQQFQRLPDVSKSMGFGARLGNKLDRENVGGLPDLPGPQTRSSRARDVRRGDRPIHVPASASTSTSISTPSIVRRRSGRGALVRR